MKDIAHVWIAFALMAVLIAGTSFFSAGGIDDKDVSLAVEQAVSNAFAKQPKAKPIEVPTAEEIASKIELPEVESADNELLNEFLESEYEVEFQEIKDEAEVYALEELEDDDYEVIVDYLKTLLSEGQILDEDSIDVDVDDTEIEVTALGLKEDTDKSAIVTFEIEVEYEFEEGIRDEFEKDLVVVYDVFFEEGDFDDEEVELVSIA